MNGSGYYVSRCLWPISTERTGLWLDLGKVSLKMITYSTTGYCDITLPTVSRYLWPGIDSARTGLLLDLDKANLK